MAVGHRVKQTLASQAAAMGSRHLRGRGRFIQEDQVLGAQSGLPDDEPPARFGDVRPPLLARRAGFF
jgi:hypothetical protein